MYKPAIGDVILWEDERMVVVDLENNESTGDCAYSRKYLLCKEAYFAECKEERLISLEQIKQHGKWLEVKGINFPKIEQCKDVAPYEVKPIHAYSVRRKQAKNVVIYE